MSTRICVNIFSGSSAREMRSLMLDRSSDDNLSMSPMGLFCLAVRAELTQVRRERDGNAFVGGEELLEVEMREFERLGHDDGFFLDAVCTVHQIGGVELEQPAAERGQIARVL